MLASVVGTVLVGKLGTSQGATLAGAAISPMIAALFTTKGKGLHGRLRAGAVALLTLAAVGFTVLGFTGAEKVTGKSLINDQSTTFPLPPIPTPTPTPTPTPPTDPTGITVIPVDADGNTLTDEAGNTLTSVTICVGDGVDLNAVVTYSDRDPETDPAGVTWLPGGEGIVTVDGEGNVTASEVAGETTATATLDGVESAPFPVSVSAGC